MAVTEKRQSDMAATQCYNNNFLVTIEAFGPLTVVPFQ